MYVILNDELYHHGIKGQKWGVRRFQNADGTRTAAGRQRSRSEYKKAKDESRKKFIDDLGKLENKNDIEAVKKLSAEYDDRNKKIKDEYRSKKSEYKKAKAESNKKFQEDLAKLKDKNDIEAVKKIAAEYDNRNKKIKDTYGSNKKEPDLEKSLDPKVLYKNRDKLSDAELDKKLNRLRKENELKKMTNNSKSKVSKVAVNAGKAILTAYLIKKGTSILDKADTNIMDKLKKATDNVFLPKFN